MDDRTYNPDPKCLDFRPLPSGVNEIMFDIPQDWTTQTKASLVVVFAASPSLFRSYEKFRAVLYVTKPREATLLDGDFECLAQSAAVGTSIGQQANRESKYEKDWQRWQLLIQEDMMLVHPGHLVPRVLMEGVQKETSKGAKAIAAETAAIPPKSAAVTDSVDNDGKLKIARRDA